MEKLKVMLCVGEKKEQNCCLNYHHVMNIKIRFNAFYSARIVIITNCFLIAHTLSQHSIGWMCGLERHRMNII